MINIISTQANKTSISGPGKVFRNLIKGLAQIGYPYVINRDVNATKRLWVHDYIDALRYLPYSKAHKVIGPNLFVLPSDIPADIRLSQDTLYIHPCQWPIDSFKKMGFSSCEMLVWPVGIDTDQFRPSGLSLSQRKILVYHKQRDSQELAYILNSLHRKNLDYNLIIYGQYIESKYKELLDHTSMIIWHGRHESQGIALQEALACNLPILVADATSLLQYTGSYQFPVDLHAMPVTSVPYFDEHCGMVISDLRNLSDAIDQMLDGLDDFRPREFILQKMSLSGQALEFVKLWEKWDLGYEAGLVETLFNDKVFHPSPYMKGKEVLRKLRLMQ